ncbi:putative LRR receptor-like serine/threonine-protein kinase [Hordeum vulgare]|nr:putative LRR receptor-like serine/threonine-protein kinase [Hordeum vulgare]
MANARCSVAGDVLEDKPRAVAGDVLEEKPRAVVGDVLEEKPRAATATTAGKAVHDVGGVVADLEKDVPEQKVTASSSVVQAGDMEEKDLEGKKKKLDMTCFRDPYDPYFDDEPYQYDSDDDVDEGNIESFIEKEVETIKAKGSSMYKKGKKYVFPYCTTKRKPKDWLYEHLLSHARDASLHSDDYNVRGQHGALLKDLYPN